MKEELSNDKNEGSQFKQSTSQVKQEEINKLFSQSEQSYGEKYRDHYLEIYKIYVQSTEKISDRRQACNSFFLTINTAIIAANSYVNLGLVSEKNTKFHWLISLSGAILCYTWYRLIRNYKNINTVKFKIICLIEKQLPLASFEAEWIAIGKGKLPKLYLPFTQMELIVPLLFLGLHVMAFLSIFFWSSISSFFLRINLK